MTLIKVKFKWLPSHIILSLITCISLEDFGNICFEGFGLTIQEGLYSNGFSSNLIPLHMLRGAATHNGWNARAEERLEDSWVRASLEDNELWSKPMKQFLPGMTVTSTHDCHVG